MRKNPFTVDGFQDAFLRGPSHLLCLVAQDRWDGTLLGFQHLERHRELPPDWADVGTFARAEPKVRGVGRALFARTRGRAVALAAATIKATIRTDNREGLGYYDAMGFRTYRIDPAVPASAPLSSHGTTTRSTTTGPPTTIRTARRRRC